jgi:hypothetical protein
LRRQLRRRIAAGGVDRQQRGDERAYTNLQ